MNNKIDLARSPISRFLLGLFATVACQSCASAGSPYLGDTLDYQIETDEFSLEFSAPNRELNPDFVQFIEPPGRFALSPHMATESRRDDFRSSHLISINYGYREGFRKRLGGIRVFSSVYFIVNKTLTDLSPDAGLEAFVGSLSSRPSLMRGRAFQEIDGRQWLRKYNPDYWAGVRPAAGSSAVEHFYYRISENQIVKISFEFSNYERGEWGDWWEQAALIKQELLNSVRLTIFD